MACRRTRRTDQPLLRLRAGKRQHGCHESALRLGRVGGGRRRESMSRVPMGSDGGAWVADPKVNLKTNFVPQGVSADLIASLEGFSREDVDRFALHSQQRAAFARENGRFHRSPHPHHRHKRLAHPG
ncbi:MAG: hypothetical protein M5U34_38415 [Chloroflexi bacterium]|nr:hypothetical protein [Chloroflexota bacterium]